VAIWNETDEQRRGDGVRALWTDQGRHLMGPHDVRGHEALEERVATSHRRSVVDGECAFGAATAIQPGVAKFRWDMSRRSTGDVVSAGVGFLTLSDDGRIDCDYRFTEA
jgi:hypothetical protein